MQTKSAVIRVSTLAASLAAMLVGPAVAGGPTTTAPEPMIIPAAEPYAAPGIDWSGAYVGGQLGYADTDTSAGALDGYGMLGGVHAGYRWDMGTFVAGAELDYDTASVDLGAVPGDTLDDIARLKFSCELRHHREHQENAEQKQRNRANIAGAASVDIFTGQLAGIPRQ